MEGKVKIKQRKSQLGYVFGNATARLRLFDPGNVKDTRPPERAAAVKAK